MRHWDEMEEDVSDGIWRLLGSAVHEIMSRVGQHNRLIEERMTEPVMGMKVTGKSDIYEGSDESIQDYKVTSVWTIKYDPKKWEEQLNTYAWFITKLGFNVKQIFVNAILRDWSAREYKRSKTGTYPPFAYQKIEIPLWTFEDQQAFIEKQIAAHKAVELLKDEELPVCSVEDRWKDDIRCKQYCNVAKFCSWGSQYFKE